MLIKALYDLVIAWLQKRAYFRKKKEVLSKYGWDCNCPGCKKLMHTNNTIVDFKETEMHWHYTCKCGYKSAWRLDAPCPMFDPSYKEPLINVPNNY